MKWALLLLCGCNRILGTGTSTHVDTDAQFFDGLPDAPFACPPIGSVMPPAFVNQFSQIDTLASCALYSPSKVGTAVATCSSELSLGVIYQGPVDGPLTPADIALDEIATINGLRLSPEGDLLIVEATSPGGVMPFFTGPEQPAPGEPFVDVFGLVASSTQTWQQLMELDTFVTTPPTTLVNGMRHLITIDDAGILTELVGDGATWNPIGDPLDLSTIGILWRGGLPSDTSASNPDPALTTDGLRLIVPGVDAMGRDVFYYTDRSSLDGTFDMAKVLDVPGDISEAYMTDDCARVYFSALDTVFYISQ